MRIYKDSKPKNHPCNHTTDKLAQNKLEDEKKMDKLVEFWMGLLHLQGEEPRVQDLFAKTPKVKKLRSTQRRLRKRES